MWQPGTRSCRSAQTIRICCSGEPSELVSDVLQATAREMRPFREQISRNETNWAVVAAPSVGWAEKIFPGVPTTEAVERLWDAIARMCRLDSPDPLDDVGDAPGQPWGAQRVSECEAIFGAEVHEAREPI